MTGVQAFVIGRTLWPLEFMVPEADVISCYRYHTTSKVSETSAFTEDYLVVKETLGATVRATWDGSGDYAPSHICIHGG